MRRKKAKVEAKESPPYLFSQKGTDYDLRDFDEFRYGQNHDTETIWAHFIGKDGPRDVPVSSLGEAQAIERQVNPFWGRK